MIIIIYFYNYYFGLNPNTALCCIATQRQTMEEYGFSNLLTKAVSYV